MKRKLIVAIVFSLAAGLPFTAIAQKTSVEKKVEKKDRKEVQVITITRSGDADEKTVVEIDGEKVKVNGKNIEDAKDVKVKIVKGSRPGEAMGFSPSGNFVFRGGDGYSLFSEDSNRAMLGVVTEDNSRGAEVVSVSKETAAEKAGIKKGDVITRVGDKKISNPEELTKAIREHKPGDKVAVTVLRDGKEQKLHAELGKYKGIELTASVMPRLADEMRVLREFEHIAPAAPGAPMAWAFAGSGPKLGVSIQDTEDGKGVKVLEVDEDGNAAKAGIKKGDVITQIEGKEVSGVDQLVRGLREYRNAASVQMQLMRDGKSQPVEVKFPRKLKTVDL